MADYFLPGLPFRARLRFRRVPYEDPEQCPYHRFPGKLDGPFETAVHRPDLKARRPDAQVEFLAPERGADKLLARLHLLGRALGKQERPQDLFQFAHFLDRRRRGARRQVRELNLAVGGWHRFPGFAFKAQPSTEMRAG